MKTLPALTMGALALATTPVALSQDGHMMGGGTWGTGWMGGYGGGSMILLLVVVIALVVWLVKRGDR